MDSRDDKCGEQSTQGSQNPDSENWCPICKTVSPNRALTDTCGHEFCFDCLKQWSNEHNSCPVCRQTYNKIITNIGPNGVFDEIPVRQPIERLFISLNQILHDLELLFIERLQELKDSITSVEQSLQTLKALLTHLQTNWEQLCTARNGHTSHSNTQPIVAETDSSESLGHNSSQSNEISSPKSKKKRDV